MEFRNIKRRKIHEDVAEQIESQIVGAALEVGTKLPSERSLMEAFNVGRPAVREALLLLQRSGFIEVSSNGRPVVARPTTSKLVEQLSGAARSLLSSKEGEHSLQDARRLFEAAIARNAAEQATPKDIEVLEAALETNRASLGDIVAFERTDVAFHRTLARPRRNGPRRRIHGAIVITSSRTRVRGGSGPQASRQIIWSAISLPALQNWGICVPSFSKIHIGCRSRIDSQAMRLL